MAAITGVVVLALLVGIFFLFRAMGSMGQRPTPRERMKHTPSDVRSEGPRATGLD